MIRMHVDCREDKKIPDVVVYDMDNHIFLSDYRLIVWADDAANKYGEIKTDEKGNPVLDKDGQLIVETKTANIKIVPAAFADR